MKQRQRSRAVRLAVVAGALGLTHCDDDAGAIHGRIFLAPITAEDGKHVGLAVEFIRTSGDAADVEGLGLRFHSNHGFFLFSAEESVTTACLTFPASGRLSLVAVGGELEPTARVRVSVHRPLETDDAAGDAGAGGAILQALDACSGPTLDDAVWPTRGAAVIPVEEPAEPSAGASSGGEGGVGPGGEGGEGGVGPGAGGAGGAGGASDGGAAPTDAGAGGS